MAGWGQAIRFARRSSFRGAVIRLSLRWEPQVLEKSEPLGIGWVGVGATSHTGVRGDKGQPPTSLYSSGSRGRAPCRPRGGPSPRVPTAPLESTPVLSICQKACRATPQQGRPCPATVGHHLQLFKLCVFVTKCNLDSGSSTRIPPGTFGWVRSDQEQGLHTWERLLAMGARKGRT